MYTQKSKKSSQIWWTFGFIFTVIFILFIGNESHASSMSTKYRPIFIDGVEPGNQVATISVPSIIETLLGTVWAGNGFSKPLPRLLQSIGPQSYNKGCRVATDSDGEARVIMDGCISFYVYNKSSLITSPCRENGSWTCLTSGFAYINKKCSQKITIETPTAKLELNGTKLEVGYFPNSQLSFLRVYEGTVQATRISDFDNGTLGETVLVASGQFWFTTPDFVAKPIGDLLNGIVYTDNALIYFKKEIFSSPWIAQADVQAARDKLQEVKESDKISPIITSIKYTPEPSNLDPFIFETTAKDDGVGMDHIEILFNEKVIKSCNATGNIQELTCLINSKTFPIQVNFLDQNEAIITYKIKAYDKNENVNSLSGSFKVIFKIE
jgi:hypothetical protein